MGFNKTLETSKNVKGPPSPLREKEEVGVGGRGHLGSDFGSHSQPDTQIGKSEYQNLGAVGSASLNYGQKSRTVIEYVI